MRILVAIDGSESSFHAMKSACRIAQKTYSPITALYVNVGEEYSTEATRWISIKERIAEVLEIFGQEALQKAHAVCRECGVSFEGVIVSGFPYEEILAYAQSRGIVKIIVMGHSTKNNGMLEFAESTVKNVLANTSVPVLVTDKKLIVENILIAVDDSEASQRVTAFAGTFAKLLEAKVTILAVAPHAEDLINEYRTMAEVFGINNYSAEINRFYDEKASYAASKAQQELAKLGLEASLIIKKGSSPDVIVAEARQYDLVVSGIKEEPNQRRFLRTVNKLLNAQANALYVQ